MNFFSILFGTAVARTISFEIFWRVKHSHLIAGIDIPVINRCDYILNYLLVLVLLLLQIKFTHFLAMTNAVVLPVLTWKRTLGWQLWLMKLIGPSKTLVFPFRFIRLKWSSQISFFSGGHTANTPASTCKASFF